MFYTYGMGPEGGPSVAVKQMWIFKISGEVSNAAFCRHGVTLKNKKIWPSFDDNCINMTRKEQLFRRLIFFVVAEVTLNASNEL